MTSQLQHWRGDFGREYTKRNRVNWKTRTPALQQMLHDIPLATILEVGTNRGHNLQALRHLYPDATLTGIEPNAYARRIAHRRHLDVRNATITNIPFPDHTYDLVLTCGVLIHIPPDDLPQAIRETARVSSRYLLTIEYHTDTDTPVHYRGHRDMLWRRDYEAHYRRAAPEFGRLLRRGHNPPGFADATWLLLQRIPEATAATKTKMHTPRDIR